MKNKLRDKSWYPYTVAACIAVVLYVVLANLGSVTGGIKTFFGYFSVVVIALIFAYIMNPLACFFDRKVFHKIEGKTLRWNVSIAATVVVVVLFIAFLLLTLIPQLIDSTVMLLNNMDGYLQSFQELTSNLSGSESMDQLADTSDTIVSRIQSFLVQNANDIINASVATGKAVVKYVIAFILSVYLLSGKETLKAETIRIMQAFIPEKKLDKTLAFLTRCHNILIRYIIFSILDALIIATANAIFMAIMGMEYIGLISMIVGVFNLIPTFGPIIGGAIGGFILLLVKPLHALIFIIFTFILQFLDPYVIKPRLFGSSLGVSGLLILVSVVVFGNMFGIIGILLAIPFAAIIDFVYKEAFVPYLERHRNKINQEQ